MSRPAARRPVLAAAIAAAVLLAGGGAWWLNARGDNSTSAAKPHADPLHLEVLDWRNTTVPGSLCRHRGPIKLRDGTATGVTSTFDGPEPNMPQDVSAFTSEVVYGDLTGDGQWEAALPVICANHNSTAAGQRAFGVMVFDGSTGRLRHLGTIEGQQPRLGEPPNFLRIEKISRNRITATETFYSPEDANCCPSGAADNTWSYRDGKFVPVSSKVRPTP
ncbi:hypothetical protein [Streptomyces fructofermentans]|uniref:Uncharacterized protein n=1 Tax=Streptomyces fructofermentans TaxID=152141 RepID=A0A918NU40_9ACTN|nr:hypothetical protein [Streptomyces fructofermentans]GGX94834.1 hypothetical protein GCM10010515_71900 [Streptomyces fructofermentans]